VPKAESPVATLAAKRTSDKKETAEYWASRAQWSRMFHVDLVDHSVDPISASKSKIRPLSVIKIEFGDIKSGYGLEKVRKRCLRLEGNEFV
jgi:hypothetical protein